MQPGYSHKKILLVYPEIPKATYWSFSKALEFVDKRSSMPPLGILTLAAMLPREYELKLVDLNVEELSDDDILWADHVFISAMIVQRESMAEVISRVRALGVPIVAGGPYATTFYADIEGVDHFVLGEAESVIDRFLEDFDAGRAKKVYARIVNAKELAEVREHFGPDIDVEGATEYPDLDRTPLPRFDLLKDRSYYQSMALQTSRGCPIGCEFCDIWRRFGRNPRYRSFEKLHRELNSLKGLGWKGSVFIVDDNFIGNRRHAKELLRNIIGWQRENGYPFEFFTEVTLTLADDDELLSLMRDAGFDFVFVGIETPAEESLAETRKLINTRGTMSEKVAKIQGYGIQVASGFILGFDNDPENIAERMIDCIQDLGIPMAMVGLLQALPDTDLGERLKREGRMLSGASGNNTHEFAMNFRPARPMWRVIDDYKRVLQSIYSTNLKSYFERCAKLGRIYKQNPNIPQRVQFVYLKALVRFAWESLFRAYRWNCWKFIVTTIFTNPRFFSMGATLAIQGHHFREITRLAFEMDELDKKFTERLGKAVMNLRKEFESSYAAGGVKVEQFAKLMDKRRKKMNRYAMRRLRAMSRKYGLPVQKRYGEFLERLDVAFRDVQMEYGLLMPLPVRAV